MNINQFQTPDTNFVSFLRIKGISITETRKVGRQVLFIINDENGEVAKLFDLWSLDPTKEMKIIQAFASQRAKVIATVKSQLYQGGGFNG